MSFVKQLVIIAALALAAFGGYRGWQYYAGTETAGTQPSGRRGGAPLVETAAAEVRPLETAIEAVGSTRARRAVEITPLAAGRIAEITFRAGKRVKAGEVLLRLDDDIQRADLIEAEARLQEAASALKRAQSLKRTSAVSDAAVDKLVATLATAQADHDRAARRLRDRTVTAPFAGVVGFSRVELGARVEDGDTVTTLDDLTVVEIEFALPEGLYGRIVPGQRIVADAAAFPGRSFEGRIETIDSRIDAVSRSFKARAAVANPDLTLPAGMFMHITVVLDRRQALTVAEEAIVVDGDQTFVFSVTQGEKGLTAKRRDVRLGQRSFGHVEVVSGLDEGEEVIVRGVQKVGDGRPVRRAKPDGENMASQPKGAAG